MTNTVLKLVTFWGICVGSMILAAFLGEPKLLLITFGFAMGSINRTAIQNIKDEREEEDSEEFKDKFQHFKREVENNPEISDKIQDILKEINRKK